MTYFNIYVDRQNVGDALSLLSDAIMNPVFDSVREQDLFIQILRETELIAQKNRNLIEAQLAANAERWGIIDAQP